MPCDSVSSIKTVYKAENFGHLKAAAEALGFRVTGTPERVLVTTPQGVIVFTPGETLCPSGAEKTAGLILKGMAERVFNSWVDASPDLYEELPREGEERVFAVRRR